MSLSVIDHCPTLLRLELRLYPVTCTATEHVQSLLYLETRIVFVTRSVLQRRSLEQCAPCDRPNLLDCRLAIVLEKYSRAQETSAVKQSPSRHRFHSFLMCGNTRTQNSSNGTVSIAAYPSLNSITYQQAILRHWLCGHPFDEICLCVVGPSPWTLVNVEECFRRGPT